MSVVSEHLIKIILY